MMTTPQERGAAAPQTLFEKIWGAHVVREAAGEPALLYIDLHLVHEVTSPQAFDGLRAAGRGVGRAGLTFGTADHNAPRGAAACGERVSPSRRTMTAPRREPPARPSQTRSQPSRWRRFGATA